MNVVARLFRNRFGPEIVGLVLALLSMPLLASLLAGPERDLMYVRFWLDHDMTRTLAWLVEALVAISILELVRRTPPPWPLFIGRPGAMAACFFGVPALIVVLALLCGALLGQSPRWPMWTIASEEGVARTAAIFVAAAMEELLFRYFLQSTLARLLRSPAIAFVIVACFFTTLHPGWNAMAILSFAVVFGAIALFTGSVWPAVVAHAMLNFTMSILFLHAPSKVSAPFFAPEVLTLFQQCVPWVALPLAAWMLWPHLRGDPLMSALSQGLRRPGRSARLSGADSRLPAPTSTHGPPP
jgi:membrane protease YdiL (CAAX protease family)